MIFQKKSSFNLSYPVSFEDLKFHIQGCFDNSDFEITYKTLNDQSIITIESKSIGTDEIPIVPAAVRLDLFHDLSVNIKTTRLKGELTISYIDIVGMSIMATALIVLTLLNLDMSVSNIITLTLISALLVIYPIYRLGQMKADQKQLFELMDHLSESCKIDNE